MTQYDLSISLKIIEEEMHKKTSIDIKSPDPSVDDELRTNEPFAINVAMNVLAAGAATLLEVVEFRNLGDRETFIKKFFECVEWYAKQKTHAIEVSPTLPLFE